MTKVLALWALLGALAASATLNVYHARKEPETAVPRLIRCEVSGKAGQACCPLVESVELTISQKQKFADCCPEYAQRRVQFAKEMDALVAKLEQELGAENPDVERIGQLADEIGRAQAAQLKCRANNILLVRETLTPDQLKRLVGGCGGKCSKR
jgi:hypothetical protein